MKRKNSKPKAKKAKQSVARQLDAIRVWVLAIENRVTRLEQAQVAPIPPEPQPQSLPEGGLPPQS